MPSPVSWIEARLYMFRGINYLIFVMEVFRMRLMHFVSISFCSGLCIVLLNSCDVIIKSKTRRESVDDRDILEEQ